MIKGNSVAIKYNEIRNKFKKTLNIKFRSMPVYDEKYIKVKVKEFNGVVNKNFLDDELLKEDAHCACIACISIDSVMKMEKKNDLQVYLEEYKYKIKKRKMPRFTDIALQSHSNSDSE